MPDRLDEEKEAQIRRRVRHFADTHTLPEDFQRYHYDDWMFLLRRLREDSAGPDRAYEAQLRQLISFLQAERDAARSEVARLREDVKRLDNAAEWNGSAANDMHDKATAAQDFIIAKGLWDEFSEQQPHPDTPRAPPGADAMMTAKLLADTFDSHIASACVESIARALEQAACAAREGAIAECAPRPGEAWTREAQRNGEFIASRIRALCANAMSS